MNRTDDWTSARDVLERLSRTRPGEIVTSDLRGFPETITPYSAEALSRRARLRSPRGSRRVLDVRGFRFGSRVALVRHPEAAVSRDTRWWVSCDCGRVEVVPGHNLRGGQGDTCVSCARSIGTRARHEGVSADLSDRETSQAAQDQDADVDALRAEVEALRAWKHERQVSDALDGIDAEQALRAMLLDGRVDLAEVAK